MAHSGSVPAVGSALVDEALAPKGGGEHSGGRVLRCKGTLPTFWSTILETSERGWPHLQLALSSLGMMMESKHWAKGPGVEWNVVPLTTFHNHVPVMMLFIYFSAKSKNGLDTDENTDTRNIGLTKRE